MRRRIDRRARRAACWPLALFTLAALLDVVCPLHDVAAHHSIIGIIIGIVTAVSGFLSAFGGAAVTVLLRALTLLRSGLVELGRVVKSGVWELGRDIGRGLRSLGHLWSDVVQPALKWANGKLLALETWLKGFFAPVLDFLALVKEHVDGFYKLYIRPILDTIDFIRTFNRVLLTFHIPILQKLDDTLQRIEARFEEPFDWLRRHIVEAENWINRIVTLDGFFQRVALIRSLERYAPDWMNMWWNKQMGDVTNGASPAGPPNKLTLAKPDVYGNELAAFYIDGAGAYADYIAELVPEWRRAVGLDESGDAAA